MLEPERRFVETSDGYPIHVTTWRPDSPPRGIAVILHGVQSHAGWYERMGRHLAGAGWVTHFPDRRGSGSNQRDRGHAPSARRLHQDVREHMLTARREHPGLPLLLGGISWGGKLAVVAAGRSPELVDRLALFCPGLQPRVGVKPAESIRIFLSWALSPITRARSYFPIPLGDPALFTDSTEWRAFIANDPLSLREASASLLVASRMIDIAVRSIPGRIQQPVLLMLAGHDRIVDNARTRDYFRRIGSRRLEIIEYPEAHHTLEFEPEPDRYVDDLLNWLERTPPESAEPPTS